LANGNLVTTSSKTLAMMASQQTMTSHKMAVPHVSSLKTELQKIINYKSIWHVPSVDT
jgi:hypothetical protein